MEVDDFLPIELYTQSSFLPLEQENFTIWSMLIAKALLKLYYPEIIKVNNLKLDLSNKLINGNFFYSLTGMLDL